MSEQKLDECLYHSLPSAPVVPVVAVMAEKPIVRKRIRRPNFPRAFKIALVEKSLQPGTNVAQLARENGINDNLLFNWRCLYRKGLLLPRNREPHGFLSCYPPNRTEPSPFRPPGQKIRPVKHCAVSWFFLPGP